MLLKFLCAGQFVCGGRTPSRLVLVTFSAGSHERVELARLCPRGARACHHAVVVSVHFEWVPSKANPHANIAVDLPSREGDHAAPVGSLARVGTQHTPGTQSAAHTSLSSCQMPLRSRDHCQTGCTPPILERSTRYRPAFGPLETTPSKDLWVTFWGVSGSHQPTRGEERQSGPSSSLVSVLCTGPNLHESTCHDRHSESRSRKMRSCADTYELRIQAEHTTRSRQTLTESRGAGAEGSYLDFIFVLCQRTCQQHFAPPRPLLAPSDAAERCGWAALRSEDRNVAHRAAVLRRIRVNGYLRVAPQRG